MSSKIISSQLFRSLTFDDHKNVHPCFSFPNSSRPCCFSRSKHSDKHSSKQTKLNFIRLRAKYGVTKVMCSSGNDRPESEAPTPRKSDVSGWKKWTIGIVLSIILPSFGHKMGPLLLLKSKVDMALEKVEEVTEVVEEVAEATEKLAEEVEEKLPDNSELKKDVDILKNLSEKAVDKAKQAENFVHQIEDFEDKLIESITEAGNSKAKEETSSKDVDRPVKI